MIDKRRPHGLPLIREGRRPGHPGVLPAFSDLVQPEKMRRMSGAVRYMRICLTYSYMIVHTVLSSRKGLLI